VESPWESEDFEGLSYYCVYECLAKDLVPAQEARLLRLCTQELNAMITIVKENLVLSDLVRALKREKKMVEVELLCNKNTSSASKTDKTTERPKSSMGHSAKESAFKAPPALRRATSINLDTSKSNTSGSSGLGGISSLETGAGAGAGLRRSSRSASRLANETMVLQQETRRRSGHNKSGSSSSLNQSGSNTSLNKSGSNTSLHQQPQSEKRTLSNTSQEDEEEDKRLKFKSTDTDSPARVVPVSGNRSLLRPSKLDAIGDYGVESSGSTTATLDRENRAPPVDQLISSPSKQNKNKQENGREGKPEEALNNVTNSPVRKSAPKSDNRTESDPGAGLKGRREKRKRNPEDCKQQ